MAFKNEAMLRGFNRTFSVSPEARPYTLRDNGFVNTKSGNFEYKRSLDTDQPNGVVLKAMVDKNLTGLKLSTVTESGFKSVDVTKLNNNAMLVEKINFILDGFVDRNVLIEK